MNTGRLQQAMAGIVDGIWLVRNVWNNKGPEMISGPLLCAPDLGPVLYCLSVFSSRINDTAGQPAPVTMMLLKLSDQPSPVCVMHNLL